MWQLFKVHKPSIKKDNSHWNIGLTLLICIRATIINLSFSVPCNACCNFVHLIYHLNLFMKKIITEAKFYDWTAGWLTISLAAFYKNLNNFQQNQANWTLHNVLMLIHCVCISQSNLLPFSSSVSPFFHSKIPAHDNIQHTLHPGNLF